MQEIAFEIDAQRVGRASGYIGGLTIERYTFTGATIPAGTRLAILTRAGVTIAAAEIAEGNAAEVDTNTQEVADLLRYQPLGACESVYIALGNADDIIALIPAVMRKNWLDDEATHPPVPANRYPTKTELDQWLARFDERAAAAEAAKADAQAAAAQAEQRATAAETAKTAAGNSATDAANSAKDAGDSAVHAKDAQAAAEAAQGKSETAQRAAETAATAAGESAKVAAASERAAISAKQSAETAQVQAKASENAAKASEAAAKGAETAARASETAAKASEQAAKASEQASAESATAAQASEQAAATSATAAEAAKTAAETAKTGAEAAKAAAASSATSAANSAAAAKQSATEAASQVTDTLKRINFCNGKFYSQYYNASSRSITWNEKIGDACLMAWNDKYIIITQSQKIGWIVVNGSDFSFISSSPYHHSLYLYHHSTFYCLGFNGSRVAIFYRFYEYTEGGTTCNYAEVLDANTGEVLIEKTYTDEEMAFIKAAPCFKLGFTCILKNGDMIHRGVVFSGEDLSIKGYVAAEEGFLVVSGGYSTYCCYLTANADNSYSGADPIIVQSNDNYSFWVDDRYTLGEDGEPVVTLRNFHVDGIFSGTNSNTRGVVVLFSKNTTVYGQNIFNKAIVRNPSTGKVAIYDVALDETQENRIVFTKSGDIDYTNRLQYFIPVNFYERELNYNNVPFYYIAGALIYSVGATGALAKSPCIALQAYDNLVRWSNVYNLPSVAYTNANGKHYRPLPVSRYFFNNSSLIYPVENN